MKKFFTFFIITILGITLLPKTVTATSYPIAELGSCSNAQECFTYCETPANAPACWSYGKYVMQKTVLGDTASNSAGTTNIIFPVTELGNCASAQACREYCNLPANKKVCYEFGKRKGLNKQTQTATNEIRTEKILLDAKTQLGCDGATACKELCSKPENYQKCREFSKQHPTTSLRKQETMQKPINMSITPPCTNSDSCKQWCQANPEKCPSLKSQSFKSSGIPRQFNDQSPESSKSSTLKKCGIEKECYLYCQSHPGECPGFRQQKQDGQNKLPNMQGRPDGMERKMPPMQKPSQPSQDSSNNLPTQ
jgi:hypothetical protein